MVIVGCINLEMRLKFWVIWETELLSLGRLIFYSRLNLALNSGLLSICYKETKVG